MKEDDVAGYMQAVLFGKRKFADREAYIAYVQEAKRALCRLRLEYGEELQAFAGNSVRSIWEKCGRYNGYEETMI